MFTNITWSTYFSYVALACMGWYLFVAARYYRQEIRAFALRKFVREPELNKPSIAASPGNAASNDTTDDNSADHLVTEVETLSSKLEEAVKESVDKGYSKEEFLFLLQLTIKEFPELDVPKGRAAVKALVASECERAGFLLLSEEELNSLWSAVQK